MRTRPGNLTTQPYAPQQPNLHKLSTAAPPPPHPQVTQRTPNCSTFTPSFVGGWLAARPPPLHPEPHPPPTWCAHTAVRCATCRLPDQLLLASSASPGCDQRLLLCSPTAAAERSLRCARLPRSSSEGPGPGGAGVR